MFDLSTSVAEEAATNFSTQRHAAPETDARFARCLMLSLDHVGRGMVLVTTGGRVLHVNGLARQALSAAHPLQVQSGHLHACNPTDDRTLHETIAAALHRGLRRLLTLSTPGSTQTTAIAVLPIEDNRSGAGAALVSLPQPDRRQDLAAQCFASHHHLTSAETTVLQALLQGQTPSDIARSKAVALCTVRTQIGQLRSKTGARSIRQLLERVSGLPPMMAVVG